MKLYLEIHWGQEIFFGVCVGLQRFIEEFEIPSSPVCPILYDSSLSLFDWKPHSDFLRIHKSLVNPKDPPNISPIV